MTERSRNVAGANIVLVTPENWFDIPDIAASGEADPPIELTLVDANGGCPLGEIPLDEARALHQTLGAWWPALGGTIPPAGLRAGAYDRFLTAHRALLRRKAEAVLVSDDAAAISPGRLRFPPVGHALLVDGESALGLLRSFLALRHSPSLIAWALELASGDGAPAMGRTHVWVRLLLQKAAVEDEQPEALACLRSVYAGDAVREELLAAEARLLEQCDLSGLGCWSRSLGLDRPERRGPRFDVSRPRTPRAQTEPDITVLVPSYAHEGFIESTLQSVLAQTYTDYRLLVVDDHSPDRTVERAAEIRDPRLRIQVNDTNLGLGDSVLRALNTIETPYVALLNSDDLFHPERLERCRDVLRGSTHAQVVATSIVPIDGDGRRLTTDNVSRLFDGRQIADWIQWFSAAGALEGDADLVAELLERNFLVTSSNIVCRTEFLRSRAESLRGLKYCLDWQVFLDAAVDGVLVHLTEELLGYRLHRSNTVWFDDERRRSYVLEVNRVLARAFGHLRRQSSRPDRRDRAGILDLLVSHAAKHSEADGFALYAAELLDSRGLEEARDRSNVLRGNLPVSHPDGSSSASRREATAIAAQALADVAQEEAAVARAAERCVTEERRRYEAELRRHEAQREQELHRSAEELRRHKAEREQVEADLRRQMAAQVEDIARMRSSPEWLVGDTVCNRAGLSRVFPVARRACQFVRDRRNRWALALGRFMHRIGLTRPRAIVASCWNFPTHSHTFVYEEMQALEWAGLGCRVFCCGTNPRSERHPAFEPLWRRRVVLESDWRFNRRDYEHFRRTRPERLEALLARLGTALGLTREGLLQESIVMMGFTFARHVELSGAEYLHTYFFYDQSFLALMAGYLLQIPRGVTAYADHMLGDYAFKCVPLHLELADIVVATSRRIRGELSAIGGGRFDAKIIVKPNGIDTARFPYVDAGARLRTAGDPELISVSRIEPKKGLIHLVEAVGILRARGVAARLHIVGGPDANAPASTECYQQLTAKIDELQISDRVVLHGVLKQPEFLPLMMKARMFIAPYVEVASGDKDGIPTAVLEAMSTGLPVIATDAGSIVEAVTDGSEGVVVPQRDAEGLADAIERLLTDPAMYVRMADGARRRAISQFDVHVTEKRLHERIGACLAPPSKTARVEPEVQADLL